APGTPCWMDLSCSDIAATKAFYGGLFGWVGQDTGPEFGGYVIFTLDGQSIAGAMQNAGDDVPEEWSLYVASDDNEASIAKAVAAGATLSVPNMAVGELGQMAFLTDPSGALFGLWQS